MAFCQLGTIVIDLHNSQLFIHSLSPMLSRPLYMPGPEWRVYTALCFVPLCGRFTGEWAKCELLRSDIVYVYCISPSPNCTVVIFCVSQFCVYGCKTFVCVKIYFCGLCCLSLLYRCCNKAVPGLWNYEDLYWQSSSSSRSHTGSPGHLSWSCFPSWVGGAASALQRTQAKIDDRSRKQ